MSPQNAVPDTALLRQRLRSFQIFFIVLSSVIGTGVFTNNGQALELAGPLGLILDVVLLGLFAVCVGETISEFVQVFPAPNAIYFYVETFVDPELAWVIGILYWYTFASVFATQMLGAATLLQYWSPAPTWPPLIFYGIMPWVLFMINLWGVNIYGWVETVGGALKLVLVVGVSCVLYNIARENNDGSPSGPINDGFENNRDYASTPLEAFCYAFPLVAYGYLGIETTAIAAFEAKDTKSIARPSQILHWAVFLLYFLCTMGIALTVSWTDPRLPSIYGGIALTANATAPAGPPLSHSAVILAAYSSSTTLASFLNGCLLYSIVSAANTSLYVASRTLYGLTYHLKGGNRITRFLKRLLGVVWDSTGVPAMALLVTVLSFYWLSFLSLAESFAVQDVIEIVGLTSSVSCLIVWAALCLAFLRYETWTRRCKDGLINNRLERFWREDRSGNYPAKNLLSWAQPYVAWVGFLGCMIIFAFASAIWWDTPVSVVKVASAYGPQVVLIICWILLKLFRGKWNKRWWVKLDDEPNARELIKQLRRLEFKSLKGADRTMPIPLGDLQSNPALMGRESQHEPYQMNGGILEPSATLEAGAGDVVNHQPSSGELPPPETYVPPSPARGEEFPAPGGGARLHPAAAGNLSEWRVINSDGENA